MGAAVRCAGELKPAKGLQKIIRRKGLRLGWIPGLGLVSLLALPAALSAGASAHRFVDISAGSEFTCGLEASGTVRCWGDNTFGQLGSANPFRDGPLQTPAGTRPVRVGAPAVRLTTGEDHACVVLKGGAVRCWGDGTFGQTGYATTERLGDDEPPAAAGDVRLGGQALEISAGRFHTCALLERGRVRCWGDGFYGQLGYGNTMTIGDDEHPATAGDVPLGGRALQVSAGANHTCALLEGGTVRCWGDGRDGRLGYGHTRNLGDDEPAAKGGDIRLGGAAVRIAAGKTHTCALLEGGRVRCWGSGFFGKLGYGNTKTIGDDEHPAAAGDVPLGGPATAIALGKTHTCAIMAGGAVRCWGSGFHGQLGYGGTYSVGDNELPTAMGAIVLAEPVVRITGGGAHTCALLRSGGLRCWGLLWGGWPAHEIPSHLFQSEVISSHETVRRLPLARFPTEKQLVFLTPTEL